MTEIAGVEGIREMFSFHELLLCLCGLLKISVGNTFVEGFTGRDLRGLK
jgi:hypothetical protein